MVAVGVAVIAVAFGTAGWVRPTSGLGRTGPTAGPGGGAPSSPDQSAPVSAGAHPVTTLPITAPAVATEPATSLPQKMANTVASSPNSTDEAVIAVNAALGLVTLDSGDQLAQYGTCQGFAVLPAGAPASLSAVRPGDYVTVELGSDGQCLQDLALLRPPAATACAGNTVTSYTYGPDTWYGANARAHSMLLAFGTGAAPDWAVRWCGTVAAFDQHGRAVPLSAVPTGATVVVYFSDNGWAKTVTVKRP